MYTNTVQSLNNIDRKLYELQITLSKYCLARRTYGRTEKAIPKPASAFGDAGNNLVLNLYWSRVYMSKMKGSMLLENSCDIFIWQKIEEEKKYTSYKYNTIDDWSIWVYIYDIFFKIDSYFFFNIYSIFYMNSLILILLNHNIFF